eukprot:11792596-Karenia_brevis.AAC.1
MALPLQVAGDQTSLSRLTRWRLARGPRTWDPSWREPCRGRGIRTLERGWGTPQGKGTQVPGWGCLGPF